MSEQKPDFFHKLWQYIADSFKIVVKYFFGKSLASLFIGAVFFAVMALLGIKYGVVMGIVTAILNMLPVIGPPVAAIICALIAVFQQPVYALYVVIASVLLQAVDQWVLTPVFVGNTVKLPPVIVLLALLVGGALWGPVGIIIAVPIAGMVRLFYDMFLKKNAAAAAQDTENHPSEPDNQNKLE